MKGSEAIVKCLLEEGVDTIFGYSGVAIDPFWNSMRGSGIKCVLVRTEQSAGHAASGYARIAGKVGVCAVTSGPGAVNLLTGIATAFADSIPMVCITGQVESELLGSDVFQEADVTGAAESFVKFSYLVRKAADIPRIIHEAFYVANSGRRGPVIIDIPYDIQNAQIRDFEYPKEPPKMRTYKPTVKGNIVQIRKVIKVLKEARRPLVCCGGGVILSGATDRLKEFVEKYSLPVVSTMMGLGVLPTAHPMYFGMVGNNGNAVANRAMRECDVLLMIGARVADRAVSDPEMTFESKVLVHMDVDPAEIGKNVGSTIPIVGDANHIFEDFLAEDFSCVHERWTTQLKDYREAYTEERPESPDYVNPSRFVRLLSEKMKDNGVYVADVGQNQLFSCRNVVIRSGRFLTSGGMGTMGYSIPAALGAVMADPSREVVAVCGDGAFQMSMCELATIAQYGSCVKIAVMKNGYLGLVREHQHYAYKDEYNMVDLGNLPDLEKIAAAYGIRYLRSRNMEGIEDTIDDFLSGNESVLYEVDTDPMEVVK